LVLNPNHFIFRLNQTHIWQTLCLRCRRHSSRHFT